MRSKGLKISHLSIQTASQSMMKRMMKIILKMSIFAKGLSKAMVKALSKDCELKIKSIRRTGIKMRMLIRKIKKAVIL